MLKTYSQEFRIASYQTDLTARMKPSAILEIMQEMAGAHADMLDVGRARLMPMNLAWVLTRVEVRMDRYPVSGEIITVETFPMPNRRVFFPRYFIFRNAEGEQIGCAGSLWVVLDIATRKMGNPADIAAMMPDNRDLTAPMGMPATVEDIPGESIEADRLPVYTDLDVNGHVNNTRYLDWCCNTLGINTMRDHVMKSFAVNYNQEILPGQEVHTVLHRDGGRFSFSGFEGDVRHFDVGGTLKSVY
jgi:acyl-ACP thioesterase